MKRLGLSLIAFLAFAQPALAGVTTAQIDRVLIYEAQGQGMVYIYPVGGVSNPPSCHGSNGNYYSFAMTRLLAKEYYAMALSAHASGATVTLWGKGTCTDQSVSETLNYIAVN